MPFFVIEGSFPQKHDGKIVESADMGLGETERCAEKRKKAGGALRYALIGAQELR